MSTQQEITTIRAQRFANTHDPLALMANTQTPFHPDHSSLITYIQHPQPNNNFVQQPSFNTNYMQQPMQNPKDISDPTTALDMALELMSKAFQLNNITPTNNNQRRHLGGQHAVQNLGTQNVENQNGLSVVQGIANQHGNGNVVAARAEGNANRNNGNQIRCYNYQGEDHLACNCTQASTSGTQTDKAPIYDSDESAEVHHLENCYDNDIFNMFTQEEQYTKLLEPILESHQVPQNDSNVIYEVSSVEQSGGTVEQHPATPEETRALYDSLYTILATEVEKVNSVNCKLRETNADLTT
ncbi:hypothetical protein Tco_0154279 [Tanacetum coccineum]